MSALAQDADRRVAALESRVLGLEGSLATVAQCVVSLQQQPAAQPMDSDVAAQLSRQCEALATRMRLVEAAVLSDKGHSGTADDQECVLEPIVSQGSSSGAGKSYTTKSQAEQQHQVESIVTAVMAEQLALFKERITQQVMSTVERNASSSATAQQTAIVSWVKEYIAVQLQQYQEAVADTVRSQLTLFRQQSHSKEGESSTSAAMLEKMAAMQRSNMGEMSSLRQELMGALHDIDIRRHDGSANNTQSLVFLQETVQMQHRKIEELESTVALLMRTHHDLKEQDDNANGDEMNYNSNDVVRSLEKRVYALQSNRDERFVKLQRDVSMLRDVVNDAIVGTNYNTNNNDSNYNEIHAEALTQRVLTAVKRDIQHVIARNVSHAFSDVTQMVDASHAAQEDAMEELNKQQLALKASMRSFLTPSATLQSLDDRIRTLREELKGIYAWMTRYASMLEDKHATTGNASHDVARGTTLLRQQRPPSPVLPLRRVGSGEYMAMANDGDDDSASIAEVSVHEEAAHSGRLHGQQLSRSSSVSTRPPLPLASYPKPTGGAGVSFSPQESSPHVSDITLLGVGLEAAKRHQHSAGSNTVWGQTASGDRHRSSSRGPPLTALSLDYSATNSNSQRLADALNGSLSNNNDNSGNVSLDDALRSTRSS